MLRRITPASIQPPLANYCHATEVPAGARWLVVSGLLGIRPDGVVPESAAEQPRPASTICSRSWPRAEWALPISCASPPI